MDCQELPIHKQLRPIPASDHAPPPEAIQQDIDFQPRSFRIYKSDLLKYGFTPHCPGCVAFRDNARQREHDSICRARLNIELLKTDSGRMRVESAAKRFVRGPVSRNAEPLEPEELGDEERADLDIPRAAEPAPDMDDQHGDDDGAPGDDIISDSMSDVGFLTIWQYNIYITPIMYQKYTPHLGLPSWPVRLA